MLGETNPTIVLKDISLIQLTKILEYIYCGKVNVLENELIGFKQAAEYFQMSVNFKAETSFNLLDQSIPEFMSQETTAGNLTMDSFRLVDSDNSDSDCTLTGGKRAKEPELKRIKLTDTFGVLSEMPVNNCQSIEIDKKKRNYFEFSEQQKKKVAFEAQSFLSSRI